MCPYVYGYVPSVSLQSKIFIVNKGGIVQFPAHSQEGPFRDCLTVHKDYESRVSMCIWFCVCGQERELLAPVRARAPGRNMGKQLWDSRDEAVQSIDSECCKREFPITHKVCAVRPVSNI